MTKDPSKPRAQVPAVEREEPRIEFEEIGEFHAKGNLHGDIDGIAAAAGHHAVTHALLEQLSGLAFTDEKATSFALGFVDAMQPQYPAEVLLCAQMAVIHDATMKTACWHSLARSFEQRQAIEPGLNKLVRTFTAQMDSLKRYRSTGQQVVRVERVNVSDGGQAVVGDVTTGGGKDEK